MSSRSSIALCFFLTGLAACADPDADFEEYAATARSRNTQGGAGTAGTAGAAGAAGESGAGGSAGAAPADFDINGQFLAYCLATLGNGDPKKSLLLATKFTQTGPAIEASLTPLLVTATSFNDTASAPVTQSTTAEGNGFTINFGTVAIPGNANAISGSDIEVGNTTLRVKVQTNDRLCAELDGKLVKPFAYNLDTPDDICIILRAPADGTLPPRPTATEFVCP